MAFEPQICDLGYLSTLYLSFKMYTMESHSLPTDVYLPVLCTLLSQLSSDSFLLLIIYYVGGEIRVILWMTKSAQQPIINYHIPKKKKEKNVKLKIPEIKISDVYVSMWACVSVCVKYIKDVFFKIQCSKWVINQPGLERNENCSDN